MYSFTSIIAAVQTFVSNVLTSAWKTEEPALLPLNISDCNKELVFETFYEEDSLPSTPELTFTSFSVESDESEEAISDPFGASSSSYYFDQSSESGSDYSSLGLCASPSVYGSFESDMETETPTVYITPVLKPLLKRPSSCKALKKTVSFADEDSIYTIPNINDPKYIEEKNSLEYYIDLMFPMSDEEADEAEPQVYYEAEDYDAYLDRLESQSDFDEDEESDDFFDIDQFPLPPTTTKTPTRPRRMEGDSLLSPFMSSSPSLSEIYATPSTPVRSSKLQSSGLGYF